MNNSSSIALSTAERAQPGLTHAILSALETFFHIVQSYSMDDFTPLVAGVKVDDVLIIGFKI